MKTNYLRNTWNLQEARTTLLQQMADHARGERLRQLRSARGMSQEDVARALGVTTKTYGAWEKGGGIRAHNARVIARYFKVKPGEIITPEIDPEVAPVETVLSAEDAERLKRVEELLEEVLRRLPGEATPDGDAVLPDVDEPPPPTPRRDEEPTDEEQTG